ncbi:MAG: hypothetical protein ACI9O6_003322 [Glaciecola sp.]
MVILIGAKDMENLGFVFGIIGMSMGITGLAFGVLSMSKIDKLETRLKELNVLNQDFKSS